MRTLSSTLESAQQAKSHTPYPKVETFDEVGGITKLLWARFYDGTEPDDFNDCCMPADGSLIRIRKDASGDCQYSRVASPDANSTYSSWTDIGDNCGAVACCASGVNVWLFYINTSDNKLYRKDSTDSGATFGSWVDMGDISGDANSRLACCAKSATEAIVLYHTDSIYTAEAKQENYVTGDDSLATIYDLGWAAQTFTTSSRYKITKVKLKLYKIGSPGPWYVSIQGTDSNGHPDGNDLESPNSFSDSVLGASPGALVELDLTDHDLADDTKYAIVVRAPSGDGDNSVAWRMNMAGAYGGGNYEHSTNAGSTWTENTNFDHMFEVYGQPKYLLARRRLSSGTWEAADAWSNLLDDITGIATVYEDDWNIVVTGTEYTTLKPGVWTTLLGDGGSQSADVWDSLYELMIAESDSNIVFKFPTLDYPDVYRIVFVENYTGSETYTRPYWTHHIASADFIDNLWREPIPFTDDDWGGLSSEYGLAMCYGGDWVWLTNPDGVWAAFKGEYTKDVTSDILSLRAETRESLGMITVVLDNSASGYDVLHGSIKRLSEVRFSPGYGAEVSAGPVYWIVGWEYQSRGGVSTFVIHAVDGWGLLQRWVARRTFKWDAADKTIYNLLAFVFARAGLEFSSISTSSHISNFQPAFTISPGENGRDIVLKLLSMVEDVLFFRGKYGYIKNALSGDSSDYTYGAGHVVLEGRYGEQLISNRVQVFGLYPEWLASTTYASGYFVRPTTRNGYGYECTTPGTSDSTEPTWGTTVGGTTNDNTAVWTCRVGDLLFTEKFNWSEIEDNFDILAQVVNINLDDTTKTGRAADAIRRKADIGLYYGSILVPLNCGQEMYDVVTITDLRAPISSAEMRVVGLNHIYNPSKGEYNLSISLGTV